MATWREGIEMTKRWVVLIALGAAVALAAGEDKTDPKRWFSEGFGPVPLLIPENLLFKHILRKGAGRFRERARKSATGYPARRRDESRLPPSPRLRPAGWTGLGIEKAEN